MDLSLLEGAWKALCRIMRERDRIPLRAIPKHAFYVFRKEDRIDSDRRDENRDRESDEGPIGWSPMANSIVNPRVASLSLLASHAGAEREPREIGGRKSQMAASGV